MCNHHCKVRAECNICIPAVAYICNATHPPNIQTGNKVFPVSECNKIKLLSLTLSTSEQKETRQLFTCLRHLAPSGSKLDLASGVFYLLAGLGAASDHEIVCSQTEDYKPCLSATAQHCLVSHLKQRA